MPETRKPLIRGICPICDKKIMTQDCKSFINGGMHFLVKCQDNSKYQFSVCEDCFKNMTMEQVKEIVNRQKINWAIDIERELIWYSRKAIFIEPIEFSKEEPKKNG